MQVLLQKMILSYAICYISGRLGSGVIGNHHTVLCFTIFYMLSIQDIITSCMELETVL